MLTLINAILFGCLFGLWKKGNIYDFTLKTIMLGMFIANLSAFIKG